ncbi:hypothetical protein BDZ45DRAFT_753795 [Acephala macrosclerotiorum]|nr:hypothetical protein BDZ45DRAFT_753795 [Acephala macrosclerotiorum]
MNYVKQDREAFRPIIKALIQNLSSIVRISIKTPLKLIHDLYSVSHNSLNYGSPRHSLHSSSSGLEEMTDNAWKSLGALKDQSKSAKKYMLISEVPKAEKTFKTKPQYETLPGKNLAGLGALGLLHLLVFVVPKNAEVWKDETQEQPALVMHLQDLMYTTSKGALFNASNLPKNHFLKRHQKTETGIDRTSKCLTMYPFPIDIRYRQRSFQLEHQDQPSTIYTAICW